MAVDLVFTMVVRWITRPIPKFTITVCKKSVFVNPYSFRTGAEGRKESIEKRVKAEEMKSIREVLVLMRSSRGSEPKKTVSTRKLAGLLPPYMALLDENKRIIEKALVSSCGYLWSDRFCGLSPMPTPTVQISIPRSEKAEGEL